MNAQAGAYATGVLALMTSAAVAVTLTQWRRGHRPSAAFFALVSAIFTYTITVTITDRPEGLLIALVFIVAILIVSLYSRIRRSTELRVDRVVIDEGAQALLDASIADPRPVRFIANKLQAGDAEEYDEKMAEVQVTDASDFHTRVDVTSVRVGSHRILRATGSSVCPTSSQRSCSTSAISTARYRHVYFDWSSRPPERTRCASFSRAKGTSLP